MALRYKTVWKKDMRKDAQAGAKLLYGATVVTAQYSFDQLCKDITDNCSATASDVMMVVSARSAAREASKAFELNPSMILAQSAIETGWGTSSYAVSHKNYFGIIACGKPNAYWKGCKSSVNARGLCFRGYATAEQSFIDYRKMLIAIEQDIRDIMDHHDL